jgi:hypothetical protein
MVGRGQGVPDSLCSVPALAAGSARVLICPGQGQHLPHQVFPGASGTVGMKKALQNQHSRVGSGGQADPSHPW